MPDVDDLILLITETSNAVTELKEKLIGDLKNPFGLLAEHDIIQAFYLKWGDRIIAAVKRSETREKELKALKLKVYATIVVLITGNVVAFFWSAIMELFKK